HPVHASLLTTAAYDGSMYHYILDRHIPESSSEKSQNSNVDAVHKIPYAHEKAINALEYHPLGHLLCSAGNDRSARFWSRARPNDPMAFKTPVYTNEKVGAWYYGVNNNVNAVLEDTSLSTTFGQTDSYNRNGVPGLQNSYEDNGNYIPGLGSSGQQY
ncbi:hypothetical protein OXX69_001978, partial [Metschnikowia pulcherrima]